MEHWMRSSQEPHTTRGYLSRLPNLPRSAPCFVPEVSGSSAPHRENTDMARHTKIKLAALATTFVAAIGIVAVAPATSADAGHARIAHARVADGCC